MNSQDSNNKNEDLVRSALSKMDSVDLNPSSFMKTRLVAQFKERQNSQKSVLIWKFASAFSLAACGVLALVLVSKTSQPPKVVANNAYVIHLDFTAEDLKSVASAEVILPTPVHFVSTRNKEMKDMRSLRLPLRIAGEGRARLPFVVASSEVGTQTIHVRLFDENNNLLKERDLSVRFAKSQSENTL